MPHGLDIDYFLGKGMPPGSGGYINYDHDSSIIVGVPIEGKLTSKGFSLKWKGLKTPFMERIVQQMKALKEAGWPRRYGMSIEGYVQQRDPQDPTRILRAFIRNVALTPTPVHPGTYVDFAKSLSPNAQVVYRPQHLMEQAVQSWAEKVQDIVKGITPVRQNPYFNPNGTFKRDMDVAYFEDVHGLEPMEAMTCARYALSREHLLRKSLLAPPESWSVLRKHLYEWKMDHPNCAHIDVRGQVTSREMLAKHLAVCEHRTPDQIAHILGRLAD